MANATRFVLGGFVLVTGLAGLAAAATLHEGAGYYVGLAIFGIAVLIVAALIGTARPGRHPAAMRDEGPLPVHMQTGHGLGAPRPPVAAMPAHGMVLTQAKSPTWSRAAPWLRGAGRVVGAMLALVVASMSSGVTAIIALLVAAAFVFSVFRHIAHGGQPHRLIPHFAPATPGARFALGALFGVVGFVAVISAASADGGNGQSVALIVAVAMVLMIFLLIGQSWDRRSHGH